MSGPSFTAAALSAMRANQPQLPSSAVAPRHTYASSYARDYAELQAYQDYLQTHAESNAASRAGERDAVARQRANLVDAEERDDYVGRSPRNSSRKGGYAGSGSGSARAYQPVRAPYAQDDAEDGNVPHEQRGGSDSSSRDSSANALRYRSTTASSFDRPDTSVISARLPPPPSKQPMPSAAPYASHTAVAAGVPPRSSGPPRTPGDTPWASHHDEPDRGHTGGDSGASERRSAGGAAPVVPTLALNKVTAGSFASPARGASSDRYAEPEITRPAVHERDDYEDQQDRRRGAWQQDDDEDEDSDAEYRRREAQRRRRQAEYEEEERRADAAQGARHSAGDQSDRYDDRRDSRHSDAYASRPYLSRADEARRGGRSPGRYGNDSDGEDEVSRPMGQMRVGGGGDRDERRYDDRDDRRHEARYDQRDDRAYARDDGRDDDDYESHQRRDDRRRHADSRDRSQSPPRDRQGRDSSSYDNDDDRRGGGNRDGGYGDDRGGDRYESDRSARQPQSLRVGGVQHQMQESQRGSAPYDSSYAEPMLSVRERQQRAARAEAAAHYGDVAAGRSSGLRPNAQTLRAHAPIFGPYAQAEPQRPAKKSARHQFDAYVESRNREPQRRAGPVPVDPTAAGVRLAAPYGHTASGLSFGDDAAAPHQPHSQRAHVGSSRGGLLRNPILQNTPEFERQSGPNEFSARRTKALGMHPSVESAQLEAADPSRRGSDLQVASGWQSRRDASSVGGVTPDRGVRIVQDRSHRHSDIFGVGAGGGVSRPLGPADGFDPPARGIRITQQRNAGSEVLSPQNLLYDRPSAWSSHGQADERDTQQPSQSAGWSSQRSLSHRDASAPVHLSSEQQAERDAYEQQLRRLHEERIDTERRARDGQTRGHASARLW